MNNAILARSITARLWRFKTKTLFMAGGIVTGVLATVVLQSVAMTITDRFTTFIRRAYPAGALVVMSGGGPMAGPANRDRLSLDDVHTLVGAVSVREWDPLVMTRREVKAGATTSRITIEGHSEQAESVRSLNVADGEFFDARDVSARASVAVIGAGTARNLFPDGTAEGSDLYIDNIPFRIRGVLAPRGLDVHGGDQDDVIVVPYTTLMDRLMRVTYVPSVTLMLDDPARVQSAKSEVERILRERHGITGSQEDDFTVITTETVMQMFNRSIGTVRIFVPLIAATAFFISALVILAIMQSTVRSRTGEIGLRRAVGARVSDVRRQLFLEVVAVAIASTAAGLALSALALRALMPALTTMFGIEHVPVPAPVLLIASTAAIATAVIGALLPARRAALLDPVRALR